MAKRIAAPVVFIALSAVLLVCSLGIAFQTLPLDSEDLTEMATVHQGTLSHGLTFPFTWRFNQDNQFFSLMPCALIYYAIAGLPNASIIIQDWLIFVIIYVYHAA